MQVIQETELTQRCSLSNGVEVLISIDDFGDDISVETDTGESIGTFDLRQEDDGSFYLLRMYLDQAGDQYKRQGIGRQLLKFHKKVFDSPITAAEDDGIVRSDGSHLTGDAPAFVKQMKAEGLIVGD